MRLYFATVPVADPNGVAAAELNRFLASHRVLGVERTLVAAGADSVWAICVTYDEPADAVAKKASARGPAAIDYREVLSPDDFTMYARLRDLRKKLSQEAGAPPYSVFTNEQLAAIVTGRIIELERLAAVPGIGQSRLRRFGGPFLQLMREWVASDRASAADEHGDDASS